MIARTSSISIRLAFVLVLLGCSSGSSQKSVTASGDTPCEKWASLAQGVGCTVQTNADGGCGWGTRCEAEAQKWIDCTARDVAQCQCDDSDALNCEGSFKPNEGPARCVDEYRAYGECAGF